MYINMPIWLAFLVFLSVLQVAAFRLDMRETKEHRYVFPWRWLLTVLLTLYYLVFLAGACVGRVL